MTTSIWKGSDMSSTEALSPNHVTNSGSTQPIGIQVSIPHDLAVQIVGSDAGKVQRIRPHAEMTKGATAAAIAEVEQFMKPFLDREIKRVHSRVRTGERGHSGIASRLQALALNEYCQRFVASQRKHLDKSPGDDRLHRTRQRLNQACEVIRQINSGLGLGDDGDLPNALVHDIVLQLGTLETKIQRLEKHLEDETPRDFQTRVEQVVDLLEPLSRILHG
jgi:hypothetical protein